jgi:(E)-4-hydroxy-3-methylbut-2-enyl-diphosphate synthase
MSHPSPIQRRVTRKIRVGSVHVGGDAPITVQTMTNTDTCDVAATVAQIQRCVGAGADIVRVSVPSMEAAEAFGRIRQQVPGVPLVADIHFDHRIALAVAEKGVDCLRINPGNIGSDDKVREVVDCARHHGISLRIGVNAGSLEKDIQKKYREPTGEALLESAMRHIDILDRLNFHEFKVSVKASNVFLTLDAYRLLSKQIDNPLHLGVTEAGVFRSGTVKSAIALGGLLLDGIGDTLRVSLAAEPEEEVKVGFDILKSWGSAPTASISSPVRAAPVRSLMSSASCRRWKPVWRTYASAGCLGHRLQGERSRRGQGGRYRRGGRRPQEPGLPPWRKESPDPDCNTLVDEIEKMVREQVAAETARQSRIIVKG